MSANRRNGINGTTNGTADAPNHKTEAWIARAERQTLPTESYAYSNQVVGFLSDLVSQTFKGRLTKDLGIAVSLAKAQLVTNGVIDDKEFLLERLVDLLSTLPDNENNARLSAAFIGMLWNDLPHPQPTLIGPKNRYRMADGSGNNVFIPELGMAGSPYARSVSPRRIYTCGKLPEPEEVFDRVLRREKGDFVPHPTGISGMMFSFATNVIHNLFRTSNGDPSINETSSYLDLAVIYGNDQKTQDEIRTHTDGLIHPDVIAEERLLLQTPSVSAVAVLFSRNHNFIAKELLKRDERGHYKGYQHGTSKLTKLTDGERDEEIFQTARLINCGFFIWMVDVRLAMDFFHISVITHDYLRSILGLVKTTSTWSLDPRTVHKTPSGASIPIATGNVVSIEFNLLYRWHSVISRADEVWLDDHFNRLFDNKPFDEITAEDLGRGIAKMMQEMGRDRRKWCIPGLKRTGDDGTGPHRDEDIARVLQEAVNEPAGAFRACGNPDALRIVDILGIQAARSTWGVCTLNEFRKFLGLKPYSSFKDHNSDPKVWKAMEDMYKDPDNIELYPGLLAEEAKPPMDGHGLCSGYTISRSILSDAVSLVRGDRFLTTDYNTHTFTQWGYEDCQADPENLAFGGMMDKIIRRALPGQFVENSVWSLFPFNTPDTMRKNLKALKVDGKYNFDTPKALAKANRISASNEKN